MITGKLSNGFEVQVNEKIAKTYKFAKMIGRAASPNVDEKLYANSLLLEYLIGADGEAALLAYVEKETGEEPTEREISALTLEIIKLMKEEDEEVKKSSPSHE